MKKYFIIMIMLGLGAVFWWWNSVQLAESATAGPEIIITQFKITSGDGQFITLYNNTASILDLNEVQLQYFNNYDLASATSSKLIKLTGQLPAHGYVVVNDGAIQACYQMMVTSASLGLSTTAGFLQASHYLGGSPHVVSLLDDYVGWSKKPAVGAQTLPSDTTSFLQRQAPDGSQKLSQIQIPGDGSWQTVQQLGGSLCDSSQAAGQLGGGRLASGSAPIPYTINTAGAALSSIPADDAGLVAPQISEVLPNPAPPKTDANDEFVELYNSNSKAFDLSGFSIQVGATTVHKYTFPDGTSIEPKQFSAFFSSDTNLSLTNSGGQVKLLDPGGNVLGKTDVYADAGDNYAWVSADGLWQWTTTPTPGAANVITAPAGKTSSGNNSNSSGKSVLSAVTSSAGSGSGGSGTPSSIRLHPLVLAGVGAAAVLYALYEYRHDLGNFLYKLRRNREARRAIG